TGRIDCGAAVASAAGTPPPAADTALTSGVPLAGQTVAQGQMRFYSISVPTGATQLQVATTNATGDVDLYTRAGQKPTITAYDCRPFIDGGNESCLQTNPTPGTWWIGVFGYAGGTYTITATVTAPVS